MKAFMSWSGGKDSSLALYYAQQQGIPVRALLTAVNRQQDRVCMHGVKRSLLIKQARSLQLPLYTIELSPEPGMKEYEDAVLGMYRSLKAEGFDHAIFGDIFLEDLKMYREAQLEKEHIRAVFPLWKINTRELMKEFIALGFKTIVVCVNENHLGKKFCGEVIDKNFVDNLPGNIDACGENGEFHTFVFDGPVFKEPVVFRKGEIVAGTYAAPNLQQPDVTYQADSRYRFYFCDLLDV